MYSCKQASQIASDALDRKLTLGEWINLKLHLAMCGMCRNFNNNIRLIEAIMARRRAKPENPVLSPEQKKEVAKNILSTIEKEE